MKKLTSFSLIALMVFSSMSLAMTSASANATKDLSGIDASYYQWGPVYDIGPASIHSPDLQVTHDQEVLALWGDDGLHFSWLSKDGTIASEGQLLPGIDKWDVALDGKEMVLVWVKDDNRLDIQRFDEFGNPLDAARTITFDVSGITDPSVTVSDGGTIYITYISNRQGSPVAALVGLDPDGSTLISNRGIDIDGTSPLHIQITITDHGPYILMTTTKGTYMAALSSTGSLDWFSLLYLDGQGSSPSLSIGNNVVASSWTHGEDIHWSIFNEPGALVSLGKVTVSGIAGDTMTSIDDLGVLHSIADMGASIDHIGIVPGEGVRFQKTIVSGVGLTQGLDMTVDDHDVIHLIYMTSRLFYVHASTFSFDIVDSSFEDLGAIHPADKASGTITLANTGGIVDAIGMEATVLPSGTGWSAEVTEDEIYLSKNAQNSATVTLFSPMSGKDGEKVSLSLQMWSLSMPSKNMMMTIPVTLLVDMGVDLEMDKDLIKVAPGLTQFTKMKVTNTGEIQEDIFISPQEVDLGPDTTDWSITSSSNHVTLEPFVTTEVQIAVHAPQNAYEGEVHSFDIVGIINGTPHLNDRLSLFALALSDVDIGIEVVAMGPDSISPGGSTSYAVKVTNYGKSDGEVYVTLEIVSGVGDWQAWLGKDDINVPGGTAIEVQLTVQAPSDALFGARFVSRVRASSPRMLEDKVADVTTYVSQVHSLNADMDDDYARADPGGEADYNFTITNNGNGREEVLFRSETPFGWEPIRFAQDGKRINDIRIEVGETRTISAIVNVPTNTLTDDYDLKIRVINGKMTELDLTTHVNMVSDIWLSASETMRETVDDVAKFNLRIKNYGNGPDDVQLITEGLPDGWTVQFPQSPDRFISLKPAKEKLFSMEVRAPSYIHDDEAEFTLRALPLRGRGVFVKLLIKVVPSDLEIKNIDFSTSSFVNGDIETISITVRNNGPGPAGRVVVLGEDNGRILGSDEVYLVRPDAQVTVTFTWAVIEGVHDLRFTVDPDDNVFEKDENNNVEHIKVVAGPKEGPQPFVTANIIVGGTVTMSFVLLGAAVASTEWGRFKLLWLFWVPLYTKLKRTGVLDHFIRGQVYGYIKANPGEHYNAIKKALSLKNGTLVYHLQTLEREEYVKSASDGRYKRFYPAGMKIPDEPMRRLNKIQDIILKIIADKPGISQKEIADEIGLSGATINYHINVMLRANVIRKDKVGRKTHMYTLDEEEEPLPVPLSQRKESANR